VRTLRRPTARPLALLVLALALVAAGCGSSSDGDKAGGSPPPPARPQDFPKPGGRTLVQMKKDMGGGGPVLAPSVSQLAPGTNRFGFALFDRARAQIAGAPVALYLAPVGGGRAQGPYPARSESLAVKPQFQSRTVASDPDAAKSLYVSDLPFKKAGKFELLGVARLDDRLVVADNAGGPVTVVRDGPVPAVGDRAPRIDTLTKADVGGDVSKIDTRQPPSTMHDVNFADVEGRKPVILVFATPQLCQSRVCGPVVDIAEQVKHERGKDAAFIHQEIYRDNEVAKGFRSQVLSYRLPTEPWLFAIDRRGRIAARIEGAFSASELNRALDKAVRG
jgi:hypothetical protein